MWNHCEDGEGAGKWCEDENWIELVEVRLLYEQ
jgi:hypothetical protein